MQMFQGKRSYMNAGEIPIKIKDICSALEGAQVSFQISIKKAQQHSKYFF